MSKILELKNEFTELVDQYHDATISFKVEDSKTIMVMVLVDETWKNLFEIVMNDAVQGNISIYENLDENHLLHYEIADDDKPEDLEKCLIELIDIYACSVALLIHGEKLKIKKNEHGDERLGYDHEVIIKICDYAYIRRV